MKFNKVENAAAIEATAAMLKEHSELLTSVSSALIDKRSLHVGDVVTLHAGLPELKTGEIEGATREWLAFRGTIKRAMANVEIYISLNSLLRGYYAEDADCLTVSEKSGKTFPDSNKMKRRFGDVAALGQLTKNGIEVPFLSDDVVITMIGVEGYRPVYVNKEWSVGDKENLVVAQ